METTTKGGSKNGTTPKKTTTSAATQYTDYTAAVSTTPGTVRTIEKDSDRHKGKGRRRFLRDILKCRTNQLAGRMI